MTYNSCKKYFIAISSLNLLWNYKYERIINIILSRKLVTMSSRFYDATVKSIYSSGMKRSDNEREKSPKIGLNSVFHKSIISN